MFFAHTTVRLIQQNKVDVFEGYRKCFLPCAVQSDNNKTLVNRPFVHWELYDLKDRTFKPLRDAKFWYDKAGLFFQDNPTYCTLRPDSNGIYDCDLIIQPCAKKYGGRYRCSVYDFDSGSEVSLLVMLDIGGHKDSFEDCVTPEPSLNVATFTDENGTLSANFSWKLSETPRNQTVCRLVFSVRSFNSTVPYDFEDHQEPVAARDIRFIPSQNVNFFVFEGIDQRRYHQFQLRVQSNLRTASAETNKYTSFVYYFEQQGTLISLSISLSLSLTLTPSFSLSCSDCWTLIIILHFPYSSTCSYWPDSGP